MVALGALLAYVRSMKTACYLDHNATSVIRPVALDAMMTVAAEGGNPSSVHTAGRRSRSHLDDARRAVADLVGRRPKEVVFTSGGTEADRLALSQGWSRVLISAVEHDAIRFGSSDADHVPVSGDGVIDLDALESMLSEATKSDGRILISVMWANNETGVVQPIAEVRDITARYGARLHVDAVQGVGRLDPAQLDGVDMITVSAHKIGGPPGVGAFIVPEGLPLVPLITGGGQELNRRSGTENLPGIAGFGAAATEVSAAWRDEVARIQRLRDRIELAITDTAPEAEIMGRGATRLANTSNIALPGVAAETQVMALDLDGVQVSAGSACSSGKVKESHVLAAMRPGPDGVALPIAGQAIRVSLGWSTTDADVERFIAAWTRMRNRLSAAANAA